MDKNQLFNNQRKKNNNLAIEDTTNPQIIKPKEDNTSTQPKKNKIYSITLEDLKHLDISHSDKPKLVLKNIFMFLFISPP